MISRTDLGEPRTNTGAGNKQSSRRPNTFPAALTGKIHRQSAVKEKTYMNTVPMREPDPNDDMGVTIDAILTRPALRIRYMKGDFDDWKSIIGDEDLEYGIRQLPEKEQAILEKYYLQQKTLLDISRDLDIPASVIGGYLIAIETRLIIYA